MIYNGFHISILISFVTTISAQVSFDLGLRSCPPYRLTQVQDLLIGGLQCALNSLSGPVPLNPETGQNTTEILTTRGYTVHTYETTSEDGYISFTVRVTGGKTNPPRIGKEPVLLFHGIATSSASWIIQPGERNLVAMLITAGYEVWLINARGTNSSMKHTHLDADVDLKYWEFTAEEMGTKDLLPISNLMTSETGFNQSHFIGYSLGTQAYFSGLSELAELNDKFKTGILLAPGAYVGHEYGPMRIITTLLQNPEVEARAFKELQGRVALDFTDFTLALGLPPEIICTAATIRCSLCSNLIFALFGVDQSQMNFTNLPFALSHSHDSAYIRVLAHYSQNARDCSNYRRYDYGSREQNLVKYGTPIPPVYNLTRISVPTYMFYGEADNLMTPPGVLRTAQAMSPEAMRLVEKVNWQKWNHNDFIMAKDADIFVYNKILDILKDSTLQQTQ